MSRFEFLKEIKNMLYYNFLLYSENNLMTKPKKIYIQEWKETKEKISLIEELIEEELREAIKIVGNKLNALVRKPYKDRAIGILEDYKDYLYK